MLSNITVAQATDTECPTLEQNVYVSTSGDEFSVTCDYDYYGKDLYLSHTIDFVSCINGCTQWTSNNPEMPCVGAVWSSGAYGPSGLSGGRECFYKWNVTGTGRVVLYSSAARLEIGGNSSPVLLHDTISNMLGFLATAHLVAKFC